MKCLRMLVAAGLIPTLATAFVGPGQNNPVAVHHRSPSPSVAAAPPRPQPRFSSAVSYKSSSTALAVTPIDPIDAARFQFFFWFFGASGAAGLARSGFPRMYQSVVNVSQLANVGPTLGGNDSDNEEMLRLNPLTGYPRDLYMADVEQVLNNPRNVEQIVADFPIEGNFLSAKGYLTFKAFEQANADANPLTVRAVFDTFATSTDVVAPHEAQALLDSYKQDPNALATRLLLSKLQGYFTIFTLLFLLGLADVIAADHAYHGWFPDWPGAEGWPASWFRPETAIWTIPDYWI